MIVYTLIGYDYGGTEVFGVYATSESAQVAKLAAESLDGNKCYQFEVAAHEVLP